MKYFIRHSFLSLFCVLSMSISVFSTDNLYEQISHYIQDSDIIDPDSLYYNRHHQKALVPRNYQNSVGTELVKRDEDNYHSYCRDSPYEVFSRRLVNMLILKSRMKMNVDGFAEGKINLEATVEEFELLKAFGKGKLSIRQIDSVISNVIRQIEIGFFDEALDFTERWSIYIYEHRIIFGAMLLTTFVIIISIKVKWTRLRIIFLIFDIMVIISFMLTWWELLQENDIKLQAQRRIYNRLPDECRQDEIGFLRSVWLFFGWGKGDCLKYYQALMTDPALQVTPLQAFSHMCSKVFLHPLSVLSEFLIDYIDTITDPLPFWIRPIIKALLVLFFPILSILFLIVLFGGKMGLRLGPFFHIYLHGRDTLIPNCLMNNDRQAIEIIRSEINESVQNNDVNQNSNGNGRQSHSTSKSSINNVKKVTTIVQTEPNYSTTQNNAANQNSNGGKRQSHSTFKSLINIFRQATKIVQTEPNVTIQNNAADRNSNEDGRQSHPTSKSSINIVRQATKIVQTEPNVTIQNNAADRNSNEDGRQSHPTSKSSINIVRQATKIVQTEPHVTIQNNAAERNSNGDGRQSHSTSKSTINNVRQSIEIVQSKSNSNSHEHEESDNDIELLPDKEEYEEIFRENFKYGTLSTNVGKNVIKSEPIQKTKEGVTNKDEIKSKHKKSWHLEFGSGDN